MSHGLSQRTATAPLETSSTVTATNTETPSAEVIGTLSLVSATTTSTTTNTTTGRSVVWAEEVIDNEFLDRKKSKGWVLECLHMHKAHSRQQTVCCIFKKSRAFDESSTDESDSDSSEGDTKGNAYDRQPDYTGKRKADRDRRRRERAHHHHHHGHGHDHTEHADGCTNAFNEGNPSVS